MIDPWITSGKLSPKVLPNLLLLFLRSVPRKTLTLEEGFTVMELLMVIVIIAMLAIIAIPSMLNQAGKARQAEAKTYVGALNRAQQLFYANNQRFSIDFNTLGIGIPQETNNYSYFVTNLDGQQPTDPSDTSYKPAIVNWAIPKDTQGVRAYLGVVDVVSTMSGVGTVESVLCEQSVTGAVNQSGYGSSQNYTVITSLGDSTQSPECTNPFRQAK